MLKFLNKVRGVLLSECWRQGFWGEDVHISSVKQRADPFKTLRVQGDAQEALSMQYLTDMNASEG